MVEFKVKGNHISQQRSNIIIPFATDKYGLPVSLQESHSLSPSVTGFPTTEKQLSSHLPQGNQSLLHRPVPQSSSDHRNHTELRPSTWLGHNHRFEHRGMKSLNLLSEENKILKYNPGNQCSSSQWRNVCYKDKTPC